jgi:hypothetical protein
MGEQHDLGAEHPELLQSIVAGAEKWSQSHIAPKWFHELKARDKWNATGMPNFDETFRLKPGVATSIKAEPTKQTTFKGDSTRSEFIEKERTKWNEKGWQWNQSQVTTKWTN